MTRASDEASAQRLCIVVRPGSGAGVLAAALRCLRRLVPGALLLVPPALPPADLEVVTIDADDVVAGPLSAATALERARLDDREELSPQARHGGNR